jgi:hypothetical protein
LNEKKDISSELAKITDDAVQKKHFDDFINNLVDQDKDRLKADKDRDSAAVDGRIEQIRQAWKAKYNHDFDAGKGAFLDQVAMVTGEVSDPALAVKNWPVAATAELANKPAVKDEEAQLASARKFMGGEVKLDKGRNVALVCIPASHDLPAINLSLIHELPDHWRFDIPNNIDGARIYNNLLTHLTYLGENARDWPANEDDAYRMVAHHVFMALYNVDMPKAPEADRADRKMEGGNDVK